MDSAVNGCAFVRPAASAMALNHSRVARRASAAWYITLCARDPSASRNVLRGTITDIAEAMSHARTLPLPDKDAWYSSRVADQNILDQTDQ